MKVFLIVLLSTLTLSAQVFPGAVGFGADWVFPEGTAEYINVTNKNNSGAGSLRQAVIDANGNAGGTIITFYGLSGEITLSSPIDISGNDIYIAGQTSPNGITIKSNGSQSNALMRTTGNPQGVIVRNLAMRRGPGALKEVNGDVITLLGGSDIVFDHCSFSWSTDETINVYGANDVTFQNSILSEPLMYSTHAYTTDPTNNAYYRPHSMGCLVGNGSNRTSWYNFLIVHSNQRSILLGGDDDPGPAHELTNFVTYNWGDFGTNLSNDETFNLQVNITNYVGITGANSRNTRSSLQLKPSNELYVNSTWNNFRTSAGQDDWEAVREDTSPWSVQVSTANQAITPFDYPLKNTAALSRQQIIDTVLKYAGTTYNDAIDQRIKNDVRNSTGSLIDDPSDVGGWITPPANGSGITDTDADGIPDSEEGNFTTLFDYVNSLISGGVQAPPTFVALTSWSIVEASASIGVGDTFQFTREQLPANATNTSDTWSTSNAAIATVSGSGLVTGVSAGSATITRTSLDLQSSNPPFSDTALVTVTGAAIPVTGVLISNEIEYLLNQTYQLTATVSPANATIPDVRWSSSDEDIAVVDEFTGLVRFTNVQGEVLITVQTVDGNFTDSFTLKVYPKKRQRLKIFGDQ